MEDVTLIDKSNAKVGRVALRRSQVRHQILTAAINLIGLKGISEMSMSELIKASNTSSGAFYGIFETKEALVEEAISEAISPISEAIHAMGDGEGNPVEHLCFGFRIVLNLAQNNPDWGRAVARIGMAPGALERGFGPDIRRDIGKAIELKMLPPQNELGALAIFGGAFLAGFSLFRSNLLSEDVIEDLSYRVLIGLGCEALLATKLSKSPLPTVEFNSPFITIRSA